MTASIADIDPRRSALQALRVAAERRPLSFPVIADVIQTHALPAADVAVLLRELDNAEIGLPPVLIDIRAPVGPAVQRDALPRPAIPSPRPHMRLLRGDEVLDISRISLADLGLETTPTTTPPPAPASRSHDRRPAKTVEAFEWDEEFQEPRQEPPALDPVLLYRAQANLYPLLTAEEEVQLARQIEAGLLAQEHVSRTDLPAETHRDLRALTEAGRQAYDTFLCANLRLVLSIAKTYRGRGLDFLDIVQEGNLGLIRAVQKFDYQQGYKFSTYATWWIRQAITRAIADQTRTIRFPVHVVERLDKAKAAAARLSEAGRDVTAEAVQDATGLSSDDARLMLHELPRAVPFDTVLDELGDEQMHDLTDRYNAVAEPELLGYDVEDVHRAMFDLSEREQLVMRRRSGLIGNPATLEEIGQELGVTRERIRQIESKARAKVAASLRAIRPPVLRSPGQAACGS